MTGRLESIDVPNTAHEATVRSICSPGEAAHIRIRSKVRHLLLTSEREERLGIAAPPDLAAKGICDAAKKHGGSAEKVIEAIGAYENLLAIKNQLSVENTKLP